MIGGTVPLIEDLKMNNNDLTSILAVNSSWINNSSGIIVYIIYCEGDYVFVSRNPVQFMADDIHENSKKNFLLNNTPVFIVNKYQEEVLVFNLTQESMPKHDNGKFYSDNLKYKKAMSWARGFEDV